MSLRTRLFASYALVVIICLGLVALVVTVLLQGYRDRLTMDRLDNMARPISVQIRSLVTSAVTADKLWTNLEEQAQKNNVYIILANSQGNIVRQISPKEPAPQPITVPAGELPHKITQATQGRFTTSDGKTFIYAAYPVLKIATNVGTPGETLIVAVPQTGSVLILASLFRPFLLTGFLTLVVSLIVAALFARSIYRPLKRVTTAAGKIAQGDYDQKIPVAGPGEIRDLAATFNHMAEEVKRSQLLLRHFVADVSHELKSPLTSIQGFAQALIDGTAGDDATRAKAAKIINDESKRMRRQVDELLELSRMQSGQFKMVREVVDLCELLKHCHEVFDIQAKEKGVVLKTEPEARVTVTADADRLEELFGNLLDNAIKNTPAGGEVHATSYRLDNGHVEITVADNGPGIHPEQLPHVFERFYQVTGVRTGVGLGLAIAKEIVKAHGGTIEARSEPGEGAEFIVRLPIAAPGQPG